MSNCFVTQSHLCLSLVVHGTRSFLHGGRMLVALHGGRTLVALALFFVTQSWWSWLLVAGCWWSWWLVAGCWLLVAGSWLLVAGCWLLIGGC